MMTFRQIRRYMARCNHAGNLGVKGLTPGRRRARSITRENVMQCMKPITRLAVAKRTDAAVKKAIHLWLDTEWSEQQRIRQHNRDQHTPLSELVNVF
jgi:hypothetical protein